jgi:hypothetical protein
MQRLAEKLREAAKNQSDRAMSQQRAEELRRKAEEMLRTASPEQRRQLEELARRMGPSGREGGPSEGPGLEGRSGPRLAETPPPRERATEIVDARPSRIEPGVRKRTISEMEGSGEPGESGGGATGLSDGVRDAVKSAERAIEQHNVPRDRRDLVRRVFQRYVERSTKPPTGEKQ